MRQALPVLLVVLISKSVLPQELPFDTVGARRAEPRELVERPNERWIGGDTIVAIQLTVSQRVLDSRPGKERFGEYVVHVQVSGRDTTIGEWKKMVIPFAPCPFRLSLAADSGGSRIVWRSDRAMRAIACGARRDEFFGEAMATDIDVADALGDSLANGKYFLKVSVVLADGRSIEFPTQAVGLTTDIRPPSRDRSTLRFVSGAVLGDSSTSQLRAWAKVTNVGKRPVSLEYGPCMLQFRLWPDSLRRGPPIYRSELRAPRIGPNESEMYYGCTTERRGATLWAADTLTFRTNVPVAEILADSLPPGRYWASLQLKLLDDSRRLPEWATNYGIPVGSVDLEAVPRPAPLPSVRVVEGVRYEAATIVVGDSVRVFTMITNVGSQPVAVRVDMGNPMLVYGFRAEVFRELPLAYQKRVFLIGDRKLHGPRILRLSPGEKWLVERSESVSQLTFVYGAGEYGLLAHIFGQHDVRLFAGSLKLAVSAFNNTLSDDARLRGTWRLVGFEQWDSAGTRQTPFGASPSGYAVVDSTGHLFVSLMRPSWTGSARSQNLEELRAAASTFVGIYGTYTVNQSRSVLRIQVEGSNYGPYVGTTQERHYQLRNDTLVVGIPRQLRETFVRVKGR